jgi:hypothetical protein
VRRLFLFPRYQRDAAKFLDAKAQDEMERHIADDPERHPLIPGSSGMRKRGGRVRDVAKAVACG